MAKKHVEGQEVMPFAEDTPEIKTAKKLIREYKKLKDGFQAQHSADRETLEKKQVKMVEAVVASGLQPDAEGCYHFDMGEKIADVWQDSTFKIKYRKNEDDEIPDDQEVSDD